MNKLFDSKIDLKLRLFYILAGTACIANTLGYLSNALLYGFTMNTFFPFVCALIIYAATAYGVCTKKTGIPILTILLICNLIEFPILYCMYGPYRLAYMMLGIVATILFMGEKKRVPCTCLLVLFDIIIIVCKMKNPDFISKLIAEENMLSVIITFLIACSSILAMLSILLSQYIQQQKRMKELADEMQRMANLDPLTQLYNRRYLTQYLEEKIMNKETEFAVVLLDIDNFKHINDTYGHMFGDEVLQIFSEILLRYMKGHGIVTRFGGEEFMLVFHSTDRVEMRSILEKCSVDFMKYGMSTKNIQMTFSGGEAVFKNEDMLVKLFNIADENLYKAKNSGKKHIEYQM